MRHNLRPQGSRQNSWSALHSCRDPCAGRARPCKSQSSPLPLASLPKDSQKLEAFSALFPATSLGDSADAKSSKSDAWFDFHSFPVLKARYAASAIEKWMRQNPKDPERFRCDENKEGTVLIWKSLARLPHHLLDVFSSCGSRANLNHRSWGVIHGGNTHARVRHLHKEASSKQGCIMPYVPRS